MRAQAQPSNYREMESQIVTDQNQSADFPAPWRPDQEDEATIKGRVISVNMGPDFGFGPYPIVTIVDSSGTERAIHAMHQILRTELAKRRPSAGDEIEVTYQGKRAPKSGNGNPFHVYRVTGGKEPEFNWDAELPVEERQQAQAATAAPPIAPAPVPAAPTEPVGAQFGTEPPF